MVASTPINLSFLDFAAFLRQRRQTLSLTRSELAQRVGCSVDTIKKLEEGKRRPSQELAALLAEQLQIDPAQRSTFITRARRSITATATPPTNLPAPLNSFFGRTPEIESITHTLQSGRTRLLTIVGPPGVGKSRLAITLAARLGDAFPDGIWFIPLAAVETTEQMLHAIAHVLSIGEAQYASQLAAIQTALQSKRVLLLLDNFEQLLDAAPQITAILTHCAQVTALVTSRTPLELYGEHHHTLAPLEVPSIDTRTAPSQNVPHILRDYAAVALFVDRVKAHSPAFALTNDNATAVAEICAHLDGIPLAIELAAGLARAATPNQLLTDMTQTGSLTLLTTNQRDRTARQQTLRAAIAWSVQRLSPQMQAIFAALGVFQGSFDLAAAHAIVCSLVPEQPTISQAELARHLQRLQAGHLIELAAHPSPTPERYYLLETLREYAIEALQNTVTYDQARRAHAIHFATRAASVDPAQTLGNLHAWRDQLQHDYPNFVAALQFALDSAAHDTALKLAVGLGHYWYLEGSWHEGVRWLETARQLAGGTPGQHSRIHTALGILLSAKGDQHLAHTHLLTARTLAQESGDLLATAWALAHLAQVALLLGHTTTHTYTHERLQIYRRIGDTRYLAITLEQMGCAAIEAGDYARGVPWLEEARAHWHAQQAHAGVASVDLIIGMANLAEGNAQAALARFQPAYTTFAAIQHAHGLPWSLRNLGLAQLALGKISQAQASFSQALDRYSTHAGDTVAAAVVVEAAAGIATRLGQHEHAAHLLGAAALVREERGLPLTENSRQIYARMFAASHKALGTEAWTRAQAAGRDLPWKTAIAHVRALLTHPFATSNTNTAPSASE